MKRLCFILLALLTACENEGLLNPSDKLSSVPVLSVIMTDDNFEELKSNRVLNYDVPARFHFEDIDFEGEIRPSGSGARFHPKWSYKVESSTPNIFGLHEFNLSAQVTDPTFIKTALAKRIFEQMGFPVFLTEYVFTKINFEDEGLFLLIERIEQEFFDKRKLEVYELFKVVKGAKFTFQGGNTLEFNFEKKIPEDDNYSNLAEMINALDTTDVHKNLDWLTEKLDLNNYIVYHAVSSVINNTDGFVNNFFLYRRSPASPFEVIPWDFDNGFDLNNTIGIAGKNAIRDLIWSSDSLRDQYLQVVEFVLDNYYSPSNLFQLIDNTAEMIRDAYNIDPYLGDGRFELDEEVAKLKAHIQNRREFLFEELNSFKEIKH